MKASLRPTAFVVASIVSALGLTLLIFFPVGFSMMGLIEEWDLYYDFHKFGTFFLATASSPLPTHRLRPLTALPFSISYALDSSSFFLLNVLQFISLPLKAIAMASIVRFATGSTRVALICGLIFLVYPADTMQMTLRSVHINWAIVLSVGGIALILDAARRSNRTLRTAEALGAAVLFLVGSLIYETGLFLSAVPLLIWWSRFGWRSGWQGLNLNRDIVVIWCLGVLLAAGYLGVASLTGPSYQMEVTGGYPTIAKDLLIRLPFLFTIAFYRLSIHGWLDGLRMLILHLDFWPYMIAVIVLVVLCVSFLPLKSVKAPSSARSIRLCLAGCMAATLGYLPYLTSISHVMTSQRTFLYAAVGATLIFAALIEVTSRRSQIFAASIVFFALMAGMGSQWHQLSHYRELSHRQRAILAGILQAAPDAVRSTKKMFVLDRTGTMTNVWMLRGFELRNALSILYDGEVDPIVCTEPADMLSSFKSGTSGQAPTCQRSETGWIVGKELATPRLFQSSDIRTVIIQPDGRVDGADPKLRPSPKQIARWQRFLGCWPAPACATDIQPSVTASYRNDFGPFWGLDDVPWGSGWREEEWRLPSFDPPSRVWITADHANLWFRILPTRARHRVRVKVYASISTDAKKSLSLSLNGSPLASDWRDEETLEATFDGSLLRPDLNELGFRSVVDPKTSLSVAIDQVEVKSIE
jgi:hypothetical protein